MADSLGDVIARTANEYGFSGAIRVDEGDDTHVDVAFGFADRRHEIPNTTATRFATASGTKGLTALTVMSLVDDGTLQLDTAARALLGDDLPLIDDAVTIEQLLGHRSGIGDYLDEDLLTSADEYIMAVPVHQLDTTESFLAIIDGFPQRERPGEVFRYNNGGFVVLALLAERSAGTSFHELVQRRVLDRADMSHTAFLRSDELPGDAAIGYLEGRDLRSNVLHLPVAGSGDGGIYTTTGDVLRLWRAFADDHIVTQGSRELMTMPRSDVPEEGERYGLGFWLHATGSSIALEGMDAGVSFRTVWDPVRDIVHTTIANNSEDVWPMTRALDAALGLN